MEVKQYDVENENSIPTLVLSDEGKNLTAFWVRFLCGYGLDKKFDPLFVMENIIPKFDPTFNFLIIDKKEWNYGLLIPAIYNPIKNIIIIRSDTYENALNGNTLDLITITHEVTHCIESIILRFLRAIQCVDFKTELCKTNSEQMNHHEEQTDSLMSLILLPQQIYAGKSDEEIFMEFILKPIILFLKGMVKSVGTKFLEELKSLQLLEDAPYFAS